MIKEKNKCTAIVLAGGRGSRMHSDIEKQYMLLRGIPVICYSLLCFEKSSIIDDIVIVCAEDAVLKCRRDYVEKMGISKVSAIVPGGKERYDSVYEGLKACISPDYVFIHDSARPLISESIIERGYEEVKKAGACVVGVPSKDTIKLSGEDGTVKETLPRDRLWIVQTPQIFRYDLIMSSYEKCIKDGMEGITDDAMVVERAGNGPVKLVMGAYTNIKITTASDMVLADCFLNEET
ncbi:MAG: 2-C-methyl-D-erythritol 4-phosphate cytidylyltransferase [Blautia sp.]|nr:2-C-methyl-D-erythritol 4-phosphate cytidylyltransferase [Blautia sp.]